ncbi:MAG: ATP-binding cassette domain-containing protein [Proteobacteria bacterium]|nr:ATP-binding cassette domain-containing protein [Pseudomonadota bacterium]
MNVLTISGLSKSFGAQKVIDEVSFSVPEGVIFGFIGQNGAGKTTTMRMIVGLLEADAGSISVCGETVEYGQTKTNRLIGYLPDVPEFYNYMSPMEYLSLCGEIAGLLAKSEIMLTKGLSRPAVIISKFFTAVAIMTVSYWMCFGITYGYTAYLWQDAAQPHTVFAAVAMWVFGLMLISALVFGCVLFRQAFSGVLLTGGVVVVMSLAGLVPQLTKYSPLVLASLNSSLLAGAVQTGDFVVPLIVTFVLIAGFLLASVVLFNKKQL